MQNFSLPVSTALDSVRNVKENSRKSYVDTVQKIIRSDPFDGHKFYIFSFMKRVDDMAGVKKMYHQPRLTRPVPVPGSTLMRVDPKNPEEATIIWTLPNEESFGMYKVGMTFTDPFVFECIETFQKNPRKFMERDEWDLPEEKIREIYVTKLKREKREKTERSLPKV